MRSVSRRLDRLRVVFDDENLVANAGLVLPATLAERLGIETAANEVMLGTVARLLFAFRASRRPGS